MTVSRTTLHGTAISDVVEVESAQVLDPLVIETHLRENYVSVHTNSTVDSYGDFNHIRICESFPPENYVTLSAVDICIHQYTFKQFGYPNQEYSEVWESLIYEHDVKSKLLDFVNTGFLFSECKINPALISVNKLILLYGPPGNTVLIFGTGKTTLCKSLVQKISIRFSKRFPEGGQLIELQSGVLLSKYFAESNKLVTKQFAEIHKLLENKNQFVVLLMDEVESLTASRQNSMNGEPMDAIRVVNCILGEIDKLKKFPNVLVLATSNVTEIIDNAFLDRADLCLFIDNPTQRAIYTILRNSFHELIRCGLIVDQIDLAEVDDIDFTDCEYSVKLWELCEKIQGRSGRWLDRILFVVHALYIKVSEATLDQYLTSLKEYIALPSLE